MWIEELSYIAMGIGETFEGIDALITAIARNHIPLSDDLAATTTWLDCYLGQNAEPRRQLLTEVTTQPPQQISADTEPARSGRMQRRTDTAGPVSQSLLRTL